MPHVTLRPWRRGWEASNNQPGIRRIFTDNSFLFF
jgi:hypothetical protein